MGKPKVFLDSDAIISALLSKKGASFLILENENIERLISNMVKAEVEEVSKRLNVPLDSTHVFGNLEIVDLNTSKSRLVDEYIKYVTDEEDSHVVFGAKESDVRFLLTHNTKHYNSEKIKRDLGILIMKPGIFLQYLRSS